jgi:hypothetical protein
MPALAVKVVDTFALKIKIYNYLTAKRCAPALAAVLKGE